MKTSSTLLFLILLSAMVSAQAPTLSLVTEEVVIPQPSNNTIQGILGGTPHTIRVFANIPDNWEVQVFYGNSFTPWSLDCTGSFYQNPLGGPTSLNISPGLFPLFPELNYDSWVTIGYTDNLVNSLFITPVSGSFFDSWEAGGNLLVNDPIGGALSVLALPTSFPPNTGDANGNVLIAQLTGTGDFSGCVNLQIRHLNPDGTIYDPPGSATSEAFIFTNVCFSHSFPVGNTCTADFDGNGLVATPDLLILLGDYGCDHAGCLADLSGDEKTTTPDLLLFLGQYGNTCN